MNPLTALALAAAPLAAAPLATVQSPGDHPKDIVETAAAAGSFGTLLAAAEAAGLVDALKAEGPLTVLAPTDEAFAALGEETLAGLLRPENRETLARILKYHVIAGSVGAADALQAGRAATLAGPEVTFALAGGRLVVNGEVSVVANDVAASNGVIHVIDRVLLPAPERPAGRLVIGFFSEAPGAQLARYLGVDRDATRLVTSVTEGGEAAEAGLRPYDLIVAVDGGPATEDTIAAAKERAGFGGTVRLDVLRRGQAVRIDAKVGVDH